jgi:hypothetical protein
LDREGTQEQPSPNLTIRMVEILFSHRRIFLIIEISLGHAVHNPD